MKNFVQDGMVIKVTAPADVVSGQIGRHVGFVGVYTNDALSGAEVSLAVEGVVSVVKKAATEVIALGDPIYLVPADKQVRKAGVATDVFAGIATKASGNGVLEVEFKLERNFSVALT